MENVLTSTYISGLSKFISGKVRDVYDLGDRLVVIATDRLSAFDVILPTGIPGKGRILTQLSLFWYDLIRELPSRAAEGQGGVVANHLISADVAEVAAAMRAAGGQVSADLEAQLEGRVMLVRKAKAFPVECVARGYISGSLWKEYRQYPAHGGVVRLHEVDLPVGLRESDKLPEPIFTPATKAASGHDENVSYARAAEIIGEAHASKLRDLTLAIYTKASEYAAGRGLIIADTKFEFGLLNGEVILIDEALTPDSSRFWDVAEYKPGGPQASFDKQYVRDYLETLDWPKTYPGPELPDDVSRRTGEKYLEAYRRITGKELSLT